MSSCILGPRGVLPPGGWAVGARVAFNDGPLLFVFSRHSAPDADPLGGDVGLVGRDGVWPTYAAHVALDLTTGPLDFGTRALLSLVAPEVEQPLCAPRWARRRWAEFALSGTRWMLEWSGGEYWFDCIERDPRRALALALAAAGDSDDS